MHLLQHQTNIVFLTIVVLDTEDNPPASFFVSNDFMARDRRILVFDRAEDSVGELENGRDAVGSRQPEAKCSFLDSRHMILLPGPPPRGFSTRCSPLMHIFHSKHFSLGRDTADPPPF